ncbi:type IV pilus biogenesis protein PilP [Bordetella flabilis]|uniref:Type IV pilus biogenesis protein PilP n=1 Tax=Bordetella flabilis TaxID=463014 RepID=A0A193GMI0_9BORD|nr:type IV pilus biogenesis protein PilP [Bordetella flabilis]ANN80808.1 hypothetical protein BAU07_26115 [Bordetella flabilis]
MVCDSAFIRLVVLSLALGVIFPAQGEERAPAKGEPQLALAHPAINVPKPTSDSPGLQITPQAQGATVGMLGRLYEQRLLIKAQVEVMNAQAQLKSRGVTTAKIEESYAPTVKMVQGVGNSLYATFLYPGNMTMDAREGDVISGGYKVESISVNQVVLSKEGERIRLGFSASPPTPLPSLESSGYAVPPMPGRMVGNQGF